MKSHKNIRGSGSRITKIGAFWLIVAFLWATDVAAAYFRLGGLDAVVIAGQLLLTLGAATALHAKEKGAIIRFYPPSFAAAGRLQLAIVYFIGLAGYAGAVVLPILHFLYAADRQ